MKNETFGIPSKADLAEQETDSNSYTFTSSSFLSIISRTRPRYHGLKNNTILAQWCKSYILSPETQLQNQAQILYDKIEKINLETDITNKLISTIDTLLGKAFEISHLNLNKNSSEVIKEIEVTIQDKKAKDIDQSNPAYFLLDAMRHCTIITQYVLELLQINSNEELKIILTEVTNLNFQLKENYEKFLENFNSNPTVILSSNTTSAPKL